MSEPELSVLDEAGIAQALHAGDYLARICAAQIIQLLGQVSADRPLAEQVAELNALAANITLLAGLSDLQRGLTAMLARRAQGGPGEVVIPHA